LNQCWGVHTLLINVSSTSLIRERYRPSPPPTSGMCHSTDRPLVWLSLHHDRAMAMACRVPA